MLITSFFGSSSYTLPILEALKTHTDFRLIITRPDKPEGRKKIITSSPPKIWGQKNDVEVITPENLTKEKELVISAFARHHIDIAIVADYGLLIPKDIFEKPEWKTLNIHFSKLPDLRGPSPVQWTILRGDKSVWISIFPIEEDLDTGPILSQKEYPLEGNETTGGLYTSLFECAATFLPVVLQEYTTGKIIPKEQGHTKASFCRHLTRDDGYVPFEIIQNAMNGIPTSELSKRFFSSHHSSFIIHNSEFISRMTRAFSPWPGVWTKVRIMNQESGIKDLRLKIIKVNIEGKRLVLDQVQIEGKTPEPWMNLTNIISTNYS